MASHEHEQNDGFHDYTIATTLEKLIAAIEKALRHILTKELPRRHSAELTLGSPVCPATVSTRIHHTLPFRTEACSLTLHLPAHGIQTPPETTPLSTRKPAAWPLGDQPHKLQEWFLSGPCLVLAPESYSGRVLEEEEAQTLLSAGAAALSHLHLSWPLFIPVHDALRDAYRGVALQVNGSIVKFDSESVHSSSLVDGLSNTSAQLEFFAKRLKLHSPAAAATLYEELAYLQEAEEEEVVTISDEDIDGGAAASANATHHQYSREELEHNQGAAASLVCSTRRSYQLPSLMNTIYRDSRNDDDVFELVVDAWDDEAPWRPWAAQDDPLGGLEVDALWRHSLPEHRSQLAALFNSHNPSLISAQAWRIIAVQRDYVPDTGRRSLIVLQAVDQRRAFLKLQSITAVPISQLEEILHQQQQQSYSSSSSSSSSLDTSFSCETSFASMLRALLEHSQWAAKASDAAQLAGDEWWLQQGNYVPPIPTPHVLQDSVRDLFDAPDLPSWKGNLLRATDTRSSSSPSKAGKGGSLVNKTQQSNNNNNNNNEKNASPVGKAAPLSSMSSRLALHVMRLGNPRATAMLWARFLRELRFAHWEPAVLLPRMPSNTGGGGGGGMYSGEEEEDSVPAGRIDLSCCLLEQKLQLLQICINARDNTRRRQNDAPSTATALHSMTHSPLQNMHSAPMRDANAENAENADNPDSQDQDGDEDTSSMSAYVSAVASSADGMDSASERGVTPEPSEVVSWVDTVAAALADQTLSSEDNNNIKTGRGEGGMSGSGNVNGNGSGEPQGVVGQMDAFLLNDPQRLINIPLTQEAPPCTEDALLERAAAAQALKSSTINININININGSAFTINDGATDGAPDLSLEESNSASSAPSPLPGVWMQIEGAMLLSDMQAFKAANHGCCLEDFVRWHSPKDLRLGKKGGKWELSPRMVSSDGPWAGLWGVAQAVPAALQRPLFQPDLEGERVLHYLETLSPAEVHAQLLSLGFAAAVCLLERAPAVKMTTVNAQVERLRQVAHAWLADGGVAAHSIEIEESEGVEETEAGEGVEGGSGDEEGKTTSASQNNKNELMAKGLSMHSMGALVNALACVEQTITAAQSIIHRLTPTQNENNPSASSAAWASEPPSPFTAKIADGLIAAALGHTTSNSNSCIFGAAVDLSLGEIKQLENMVGDCIAGDWVPKPFMTEWCLEMFSEQQLGNEQQQQQRGKEEQQKHQPAHRLYVKRLPAELRVATTMTSEL